MEKITFNSIFLILCFLLMTQLSVVLLAGVQSDKITQEQLLEKIKAMEIELVQLKANQQGIVSLLGNNKYVQTLSNGMIVAKDALKFTVDKIDKIISKKAFIAAMLIIGPVFGVYYRFCDPFILQKIIKFFSCSGAETAVNVTDAMLDGMFDGIMHHPSTFIKIGGIMTLNNIFIYGMPLILSEAVKLYFSKLR